ERRQDQHRRAIAALAQGRDDAQAVEVRQLAIRDDHVVRTVTGLVQAVTAVRTVLDTVAALAQSLDEILGGLQVVFDQEQAHLLNLTNADGYEDLRIITLDQQRDHFAVALLRGCPQLVHRLHLGAVDAQDDVAGPHARDSCRTVDVLDQQVAIGFRLTLFLLGQRPHREAEPRGFVALLRVVRGDALALVLDLDRANRQVLGRAVAPHFERYRRAG